MQQYFYNEIINTDSIQLTKDQNHHIKNVIRLKPNSKVRIIDSLEKCYIGQVAYQEDVKITSLQLVEDNSELKVKITLVSALIKKDKWDFLIQKASELGVYQIVGLNSSRCVVKLDEKKEKKLERWNKITLEACEQARRTHHATVEDVIDFMELEKVKSELNLIAYEDIDNVSYMIKDLPKNITSVTIVIGPEGGFSEKEIKQAVKLGFKPFNLGKRILRSETAGMVAVNLIGNHYE